MKSFFYPIVMFLVAGVMICVPYCLHAAERFLVSVWEKYLYDIPLDACLADVTMPVDETLCAVSDSSQSMAAFFAELEKLRNGQDTVINIVHLGDSHIQAGYYSGQVMRLMQQEFGNAGRGWIAPLKLCKVNEPNDYFISSSVRNWEAGRAIQSDPAVSVGIGGIGIRTPSSAVDLDVIITPANGAGYSFNQAVLYRNHETMPLFPGMDADVQAETFLGQAVFSPGVLADTFCMANLTDTLHLEGDKRLSTGANTYYGLNLTNGRSGILYHSIGNNGSMFVNYTDPDYICQLAMLKPSLLIVSLGTNETFGKNFSAAVFAKQIRDFLVLVREHLPETAILLTTPPECYRTTRVKRKLTYTRNTNTELAARAIVGVAAEEGIACWDLFAATGGKNSYKNWFSNHLMGKDRIHFTKEGYQQQGTLLYYALMRSYNATYVKSHLAYTYQAAFIQTKLIHLLSISYLRHPNLLFSKVLSDDRPDDFDSRGNKSVPIRRTQVSGLNPW